MHAAAARARRQLEVPPAPEEKLLALRRRNVRPLQVNLDQRQDGLVVVEQKDGGSGSSDPRVVGPSPKENAPFGRGLCPVQRATVEAWENVRLVGRTGAR